jgi:hypothetical protein
LLYCNVGLQENIQPDHQASQENIQPDHQASQENVASENFLDATIKESYYDIAEGKKLLESITVDQVASSDAVMADETAHMKRSAETSVAQLDHEDFVHNEYDPDL